VPYAEVNGTRLWYEERGEGTPVVFLHAGLMDSRQWDRQLDVFGSRFRAIAYDARGYGRSDAPTVPFSHWEDLRGLLDGLDVDRPVLVGNSMGGASEIDFVLECPERVQALVLVGSGLGGVSFRAYDDEQTERAEKAEEARDLAAGADLWLEVWAPLCPTEPTRTIAHENTKVFLLDDLEQALEPPAADRLAEIDAPALVLVGDHEVSGIVEIAGRLEREIRGAKRLLLENADHLPNLSASEDFDRVVLDFLQAG
jgi:pimeloyl-ACP methyl ester carboxylesterase